MRIISLIVYLISAGFLFILFFMLPSQELQESDFSNFKDNEKIRIEGKIIKIDENKRNTYQILLDDGVKLSFNSQDNAILDLKGKNVIIESRVERYDDISYLIVERIRLK